MPALSTQELRTASHTVTSSNSKQGTAEPCCFKWKEVVKFFLHPDRSGMDVGHFVKDEKAQGPLLRALVRFEVAGIGASSSGCWGTSGIDSMRILETNG